MIFTHDITLKVKRKFRLDQFRAMCIQHDLCNACTIREYDEVMIWIENHKDNVTDKEIIDLAIMVTDLTLNDDLDSEELIAYAGWCIMQECVTGVIETKGSR